MTSHPDPDYNRLLLDLCIHGVSTSQNVTTNDILKEADVNYQDEFGKSGLFLAVLNGIK